MKAIKLLTIAAVTAGCLIARAQAANLASDNATDPAYSGGWTNGSNGGYGFTPWNVNNVYPSTVAGFFIGSSTDNGYPPSLGIDIDGKSFGLYASQQFIYPDTYDGVALATRSFTGGGLSVGQTFQFDMDNGLVTAAPLSGAVGYELGDGLVRFQFFYEAPSTSYGWNTPITYNGLHMMFTLTGVDTYTFTVTPIGGIPRTFNGTLGGNRGEAITTFTLLNESAGPGPDYDLFFNSFEVVPGPPPFEITSIALQGNDVALSWQTTEGAANIVQASDGAADGSYSNNFVNISPMIFIPGTNATQGVCTNYVDTGGATNQPSRYYRVEMVFAQQADNAAEPAYSGGWTNGSNGGIGLNPWNLTGTGAISSTTNGFYLGSSTNDVFRFPGIDTRGSSWGMYANSTNFVVAYRSLEVPVSAVFKMDMDNGYIDPGNTVGFVLNNGSVSGNPTNYNSAARFQFLYMGGSAVNSYAVIDASGLNYLGVPWTSTGLHLVFSLGTNDTYTLSVIDNASGATSATWNGTLGGTPGSSIDSIALYNNNAGSGSDHDVFFNSLTVFEP
jgi:hypothetical protein